MLSNCGAQLLRVPKSKHQRIGAFKLWCSTLESPLDSKDIKPVNPNGNLPWIFLGRTDAEAEAPILCIWYGEITHWERPWFLERKKTGGEGDGRGWGGWMALFIPWTWVWANSRIQWRTWKLDVLQSMGLQRVGHDWATELSEPKLIPDI